MAPTTLEVKQHPAGGYTVAVPIPGTSARIYAGHYECRRDAQRGLTIMEQTYERRRRWTKNDTCRLLDERVELANGKIRQWGNWLRIRHPAVFQRAHAQLAALRNDEERNRLDLTPFVP